MTPTSGGGGAPGSPPDDVFRALAHERRRRVLYYLYEYEGAFTLEDLAIHVAGDECGDPPGNLSHGTVSPVRLSLHVQHVPLLARAGLVRYDRDTGTVELTEYARDVEPTLRPFVAPATSPLGLEP